MHEIGLCEGVVETVLRRAAGRPVRRIRLRAGVRHAIVPESMSQAFALVAAGTEAASATVDLVTVPARLRCETCGAEADTVDLLAVCPSCGSDRVRLTGGDELVLESIEYRAG
ncbi:hydrogenase maturation nickel metallochaperone HypA [Phytohabitans rumicis]|uniref:Hydrogenase maturation factor HypA n=1 Tax=Phytohabitans rumicis TaxID=1076125 RepID=A0A6V8LAH7_9ACTN|nr:hydrogenase maturation nickel metallochaperone HypA [Phytohabitans rumicis]GFJ94212.1 putative hydrogenase nickel incorporation protein HypA 2 [Phytohabitans rumicis]